MTPASVHGGHIYEFDGVRYPSVTTILSRTTPPEEKKGIEEWRKRTNFKAMGFKDADDYVKYTAVRGTLVHYNVIGSVVRQLTPMTLDSSDIPPVSQWGGDVQRMQREVAHCRRLFEDMNLVLSLPISAEVAGYHPEKRYAGTKDLHVSVGQSRVKTIIDFKTSSRIYDKHLIQGAAYFQMANYWCPGSAESVMIIALNPGKAKAIKQEIKGVELDLYIDEFNDRLADFWRMPSVKREYGI